MNKYFSLIKSNMSEGMNLFKVSVKNKNSSSKIIIPIFIALMIMGVMYSYSEMLLEELEKVNMQFVVLTLFIFLTSITTLVEGIYKSGNLLFNCKDDNLLLSLPIKKKTVVFIRIFKFYVFELLYNSLFLLPAIVSYAIHTNPDIWYYIVSIIGLIIFPIIPIIISCIVGTFIVFIASKFKGKNIVQTIVTVILLIVIMYASFNFQKIITDISNNASSINDFITKVYYPAGAYIELITNFNALKLFEFITINLGAFIITILLIGKLYFKINSSAKSIKLKKTNKEYKIKSSSPIRALIKKELNRFVSSTVFITNAGFGLVLFIIGCIVMIIKFDSLAGMLIEKIPGITIDYIKSYMPAILFVFNCFASLMTSITSSMISLEGKSFGILKSLPLKPYTIVKSKILTAVLIMIPCILIGNIIVFVKFNFDLISIILILIATILLPLLSETIGIIVNLKYPRMDAKNDTEVVKQSMSSSLSVFIGMGLLGIIAVLVFKCIEASISNNIIIAIGLTCFAVIYTILVIFLHKTCEKSFNNIIV